MRYSQVLIPVVTLSESKGFSFALKDKSVALPYSVGSAYDYRRALLAVQLDYALDATVYNLDVCKDKANTAFSMGRYEEHNKWSAKADKWTQALADIRTAIEENGNILYRHTVAHIVAYCLFPICRKRHGKNSIVPDEFTELAFTLACEGDHKNLKPALVAMMNNATSADKDSPWAKGFSAKVKQATVENAVHIAKGIRHSMGQNGITARKMQIEAWTVNTILDILQDTFRFVPAPEDRPTTIVH